MKKYLYFLLAFCTLLTLSSVSNIFRSKPILAQASVPKSKKASLTFNFKTSVTIKPKSISSSSSSEITFSSAEIPTEVKQKPLVIQKAKQIEPKVEAVNYPSITIQSIGMNRQELQYATIKRIDDLYSKMKRTPIIEDNYSPDLCTKNKNAYVLGHSEPSYFGETGNGLYTFSRLEEVQVGDIITVTNIQGQECSYRATAWDFVRTDSADQITRDQFNKLFYPSNGGKSTLTLQTCQKGSTTVRLILRAEMI